MSKKQLLMLSLVASIPAAGLLLKMLLSLLHLLSDQSDASVLLWIVYVVCLLGSAFIAFLPLLLWLYYPAAGFESSAPVASAAENSGVASPPMSSPTVEDDENVYEEEEYVDEDDSIADAEDDNSDSLFDQDAIDDVPDDFDGEFDFDDDNKK